MVPCENLARLMTHLDWHQSRREQTIPAVSVLIGEKTIAVTGWQQWCADRSHRAVWNTSTDLSEIIANWLTQYAAQGHLMDEIKSFFLAHLGDSIDKLPDHTTQPIAVASEALIGQTVFGGERPEMIVVFEVLAQPVFQGDGEASSLVEKLQQLVQCKKSTWPIILQVLWLIFSKGGRPALLFFREKNEPLSAVEWLTSLATVLEQFSAVAVKIPVAVTVDKPIFEAYRTDAMESRSKTILCESVLQLPHVMAGEAGECLTMDCLDETKLANMDQRVVVDERNESTNPKNKILDRENFSHEPIDQARSIAERILYEQLQTLPETIGFFQLNERIDIPFGPRKDMEVDLLCKKLHISIEIDGYYHFQNVDAYRRDRRKDWLLQRHGYWVLRFLAEDIPTRLDDILNAILETVKIRLIYP